MKNLLLLSFLVLSLSFVHAQTAGNALKFDGENDYVSIPDAVSLKSDTVTIEAWVKPSANNGCMIMKPNSRGPYAVQVEDYGIVMTGGRFQAIMSNNGNQKTSTQINAFTQGQWYHVAAVFSAAHLSLYVNGVLQQKTVTGFSLDHGSFPLILGTHPAFNNYANITLDEVRIFNTNRSAQIVSDMTSLISPSANGLVTYYNFDNGAAGLFNPGVNSLTDQTTSGNVGTLNNFALSGAVSNWASSYALTIPTILPATNITATSFTANWVAPVFGVIDHYLIDLSYDSLFSSGTFSIYAGSDSSFTVTNIDAGAKYYYRVRANVSGANGAGAYSGFSNFQPPFLNPTITSFSPTTVTGSGTVTITGTNFSGTTTVSFGGVSASSFTILSATTISATIGDVSSGSVQVTSPGGSASLAGFNYIPTPIITSVTPLTVTAPNTLVSIKGKNFTNTSRVSFMGLATSYTVVSDTLITAMAGVIGFSTSSIVRVETPSGSDELSGFSILYTGVTGDFGVCKGGITTLTASGLAPFTWYDAATAGNLLFAGAVYTTPVLNTNTSYWVSGNGGHRQQVNIRVVDTIAIVPNATPSLIGIEDTVRLSGSGSEKLGWFLTPTGGEPIGTSAIGEDLIVRPTANTTYYVEKLTSEKFVFKPSTGYDGTIQTWTVPTGVNVIRVEAVGSRGGGNDEFQTGGKGGRVLTNMNVVPGQVLNIFVGKAGDYNQSNPFQLVRGWNGGSGIGVVGVGYKYLNGGGDGTDIRMGGINLTDRVIVAGGGGGAGACRIRTISGLGYHSRPGGDGGGLEGASATCDFPYPYFGGDGGSQVGGGLGTALWGGLWGGAMEGERSGGGGGYYGGGYGETHYASGAGGSSYTNPNLCYNVDHTRGYWYGDGYVIISYYSECSPRVPVSVTIKTPPTVTAFSPTILAAGGTITIKGTNFNNGIKSVHIGGTPVVSFSILSDTVVTAVLGIGGTGNVTVNGAGGSASLSGFTFIYPVFINSYYPVRADSAGTVIHFTGTNMSTVTSASFGGVPATSVTANSATSMSAVIGSGASGRIVFNNAGGLNNDTINEFYYGPTPGNALEFDGVNDYVNIERPIANDFTIEYWMRTTQVGVEGTHWSGSTGIVDGETPGLVSDFGTALSGNKLAFGLCNTAYPDFTIRSSSNVNTGQWVHVAVTRFKATGEMKLYINGKLEASAMGYTNELNAPPVIRLGSLQTNINFFKGSLDELRIWDRVRTAAEISASMRIASNGNEANLVAYYPFDKGVAGGNNTGKTRLPDMSFRQTASLLNNFALTGTASNWVQSYAMMRSPLTSVTPTTAIAGTIVTIHGKHLDKTFSVLFGGIPSSSFTIINDTTITAVAPSSTQQPSNYIIVNTIMSTDSLGGFTYTGTPTIASFTPKNGIADSIITITGTNFVNVSAVTFGGVAAASYTVVSPTTIHAVLGGGASGDVRVTTPLGTAQRSGFIYSATLNTENCLKFDGINDYVNINRPVENDFTIEYWMRTTQVGVNFPTWSGCTGIVDGEVWDRFNDFGTALAGNKFAFGVGTHLAADYTIFSSSDVNTGEWVHVAVTRQKSNGELKIYINGVLETTGTGNTNTLNAPPKIRLGGLQATGNFYNGSLDELRIWNTVRTASQISYYKDSAMRGTEANLVSYYTFNHGTAGDNNSSYTSLIDKTANNNSSTLVNFSLTGNESNWISSYVILKPKIRFITPTTVVANTNTPIKIHGNRFADITSVVIGKDSATSFQLESDTVVSALFNSGALGLLRLVTPGGKDSIAGPTYTVAPVMNTFAPVNGGVGVVVTIRGKFFNEATAVSIGGIPATSFTIVNASTIQAIVAANASISDSVIVTTPYGVIGLGGFAYHLSSTISLFIPTTALTGDTIYILGTRLSTTTSVRIGGVSTLFSVLSDTTIRAIVANGASDLIEVTTYGGTVTKTGFNYIGSPFISHFYPAIADSGKVITVYGKYLSSTSQVKLAGIICPYFTAVSDSVLEVTVPLTISGNLVLTTIVGTVTKSGFSYGNSPGNALKFDGTNDYVRIPDVAALRPSTLTIEAWVKPNTADGWIVFKPNTITNYDFGMQDYAVLMNGGKFQAVRTNRINYVRSAATQSSSYTQGVWYHVAAVFSSSSISLYVNGIFQQSIGTGFAMDHSTEPITIGAHPRLNSFTNCTIDELRFFNTDRTPYIYNDMLTGIASNTAGLIASFSFDQGVAGGANTFVTSLTDQTANHLNGTLNNFSLTGINSNWVKSLAMNQPQIMSVSPTAAVPGSTVQITGTKLIDVTNLSFGGVPAQSYTVDSDSGITAVLGAGATGVVKIITEGGEAVLGGFTALIPPVVNSFSPTAGGPGMTVTITGNQFAGVTAVSIGGVPVASFTVNSITTITAVVSGGANGAISVTTGAGTASRPGFLFYNLPSITSFTPQSLYPGGILQIKGTNFLSASAVKTGAANVLSFIAVSDTLITAEIGANGLSGNVSVTTASGNASLAGFTFITPPIINMFLPTTGVGNTTITIRGSKFLNTTAVSFGNVPATSFTVLNDSVITAAVSPSAASGKVKVTTSDFGTVSRDGFWFGNPPGNALRFENTMDYNYLVIPDAPQQRSSTMSFEFWFKPNSPYSGHLFSKGYASVDHYNGKIYINGQESWGTLNANTWYHIGVVYNSDAHWGFVYVNGSMDVYDINAPALENEPLLLGGGYNAYAASFTMDEFKIYNSDRTTQIESGEDIYRKVNLNDSNLVGYYSFDQGIANGNNSGVTTLNDFSRYHNDGILNGSVPFLYPSNFTLSGTESNWVNGGFRLAPKIESFSPTTTYADSVVTIRGYGFTGVTTVYLGGASCPFTFVSDSVIRAVVNINSLSGEVKVITDVAAGTGPAYYYNIGEATLGGLTVISQSIITSFTPVNAKLGTTVTINGINLNLVTAVSFGGASAASFTIGSPSSITAVVGTGATGSVSITNSFASTSSKAGFTFFVPPVLTSFAPTTARSGDVITIRGNRFTGATSVAIGGSSPISFAVVSDSIITAIVGLNTSGSISVTTPGGTDSTAGFMIVKHPFVMSFTPTFSAAGGTVAISGFNFNGATDVRFGGTSSPSYTVVSDTLIIAYVGIGASGSVQVTTAEGIASALGFVFSPTPVITSFNPVSASAGSTISIKGTGFTGASNVSFGVSAAVSFTVVSDTLITATLGSGSTGSVRVVTNGGTATRSGFIFTVPANESIIPVITHTVACNNPSLVSSTITGVAITDASGINTTAGTKPRLYYKKKTDANTISGNTSTTAGWKHVEANGNISPFDFTIDYNKLNGVSVATGDTIQYFIVAQDMALVPNTAIKGGTFATAPASVNLVTANLPATLSHSYFVGTLIPQVTIAASQTTICGGNNVTFTATPILGGATPTYQWKKNGTNVGTGVSYTTSSLANNDTVYCEMTSNYITSCPIASLTPLSNKILMNVGDVYAINNAQTICNGSAYILNGHSYTSAGTYRDTLHTTRGCDSIIVTQLNVNPVYSVNNSQTICAGTNYSFNGHAYTVAGTYRDTLHSALGCDSIIVTQLLVNPVYTVNNAQTICSVGSYAINGHTYSVAGTYRDTLHSVTGCDSIIVTQLNVSPTFTVNTTQTICFGSSYAFNGHTYTTAGTYRDTLGCTIIVTQLTVNGGNTFNNFQTICSGKSYTINAHTYTIAGTYRDTLHTALGCDSFVVTQLTVNPTYVANNPQTICAGTSFSFNGHTYAVAGNYTDTLHSVTGCDSIIVTQLNIIPVYSINNPQTICAGTSYSFNGHTYAVAGNYNDTLHSALGCDSIIVTQLNVNPVYTVNNLQTICAGTSYSFNGHTYAVAGTYRDTLVSVTGCDSIIVTQLNVNPVYSVNNPQTICEGTSYSFNGNVYAIAGTYRDTLVSVMGCDSFVVTHLTVNPTYAVNNPQTICAGKSYSFNGHSYSVAGNYNDTLHSVSGCDSIITTQLSINAAPVATATTAGSTTFCAGGNLIINANIESGLTYRWLQNNAAIATATADNYLATATGNYRVITTNGNGCSDTSTAVVVNVNAKPTTSAISGAVSPQVNSFEAYSVVNTIGSTYQWIVTNGTLISGGNSNLIVVRWGATVGGASVKVIETNNTGCIGDTILQNTNLALPVKLISFTGVKERADIVLKWTTASELNNDYFIVQRSIDGKQFENIGSVKGNGTTNNLSNYNYVDISTNQLINQSTIFYRLKQVDFDGKFEYTKTIVVNQPIVNGQQLTANVFPNPFATQATLNINSAIAKEATLRITDANGKVVTEKQVELYEGETIVDLTDFANSNLSGVYVVQIITATDMVTQRIMKAK